MSFVSYAQNFEDVMLWRALRHVENGFYIDVGANDPAVDSVTKAFYERGWHGINIEPLPSHHRDLEEERPRDINLQCAAGAVNGEIEVWECDVRGWATASAGVVAQHTANGHSGAFHKVPVSQLTDICDHHVSGQIHFLKIDVEGFEKSVIDGMDFSRFRPWILVIEATRPNSTEEIHDEWEGNVLSAGYVLAYTDGLNRFYVAQEHAELLNSLRYPPNVFDGFIRSEQLNSEFRAQQAESRAQQAESRAQQAESRAQQAESRAQQAESRAQQAESRAQQAQSRAQQAETTSNERLAQLHEVYASTSWRGSKPLRAIKRLLAGDFAALGRSTAAVKLEGKRTLRPVLSTSIKYVFKRPALRKVLSPALKAFPSLHQRLLTVAMNTGVVAGGAEQATLRQFVSASISGHPSAQVMTPRARKIYQDLKLVIENKNTGSA